jgi:hypothetical protein
MYKQEPFIKVIHPCDCPVGPAERKHPVFCKIEFDGVRLSISGVIGPQQNGDAVGSSGQIDMGFAHRNPQHDDKRCYSPISVHELQFSQGWCAEKWLDFLELWHLWHLNDLRAGCAHQRDLGWELDGYDKHPSEPCPVCGYKYGTAWNTIEVPNSVIECLAGLPDTDQRPNWI